MVSETCFSLRGLVNLSCGVATATSPGAAHGTRAVCELTAKPVRMESKWDPLLFAHQCGLWDKFWEELNKLGDMIKKCQGVLLLRDAY